MAIDWSKSPSWAQAHGRCGHRNFWISEQQYASVTRPEKTTRCTGIFGSASFSNIVKRPQQWPETDERINNIGLNRTTEDMGHYDEQREVEETKKKEIEKCQEEVRAGYDRKIIGKYGSGVCTVDIYRVLDAYQTGSPAIDHAIKKLLCAGKRGYKDKRKDYMEAIQSISQELSLIDDKSKL